jgi:putative hydrolase of the HAD superfamily
MATGVLFDLFGTVVRPFSRTLHGEALRHAAVPLGLDPARCESYWEADYPNRIRGRSGSIIDQLCSIAAMEGVTPHLEHVDQVTDGYRKFCDDAMEPLPWSMLVLESLAERSVPVGLVSNAAPDFAEAFERCELRPMFATCTFSCVVGYAKPDPAIYRLAAESLGVEAKHLLFVGDGSDDELAGAERSGLRPALVPSSTSDTYDPERPELSGWKGIVLENLTGVLPLLD